MSKIIRTPTCAEGGITLEEKLKMNIIVEKWKSIALRTHPINKEKITIAINKLYEAAGLKHPRIVTVPSPLVGRFAAGIASAVWHLRKTNAATYAATDAATDAATRAAPDGATYAATYDATDAATDAATYAATRAATDDATNAATDAATDDATDAAITKKQHWLKTLIQKFTPYEIRFTLGCISLSWKLYQGWNMWTAFPAYGEAIRDVLNLKGLPCWNKYQAWEDTAKEGGFRYMHEEFCIVSDFPEVLKVDDQNRALNEHGPSHRWRDGFEIYHLHGVRFPKELCLKIISREMDMSEILAIEDIDQRVQAMKFAKNGLREFYQSEGGKMLDHYVKMDTKGRPINYELWKIPAGKTFNQEVHFAIYNCPSAIERGEQREYSKGVPAFNTVAEALSWGMSDDQNVLTPEDWKQLLPLRDES